IGSPLASAEVIAGQLTSTAPPSAVLTRSAVGVPPGALGLPAGCSAEDQSDHCEGSSARFEACTRKRYSRPLVSPGNTVWVEPPSTVWEVMPWPEVSWICTS